MDRDDLIYFLAISYAANARTMSGSSPRSCIKKAEVFVDEMLRCKPLPKRPEMEVHQVEFVPEQGDGMSDDHVGGSLRAPEDDKPARRRSTKKKVSSAH